MALRKQWILKEYDEELMYEFADALSVTPSVASLLLSRGYTNLKKAKAFLFKETDTFHNPFLMPDAAAAAARIKEAFDQNEVSVQCFRSDH